MSDAAPLPPGSRRQARERALELLYEAEAKDLSVGEILADLPVEPDAYAVAVVTGVEEHRSEIDALLERFSENWRLDRMPAVDRAVLRLGTFEILHRPDVPTSAVLSEAVALASGYSTDNSGRFVNGLLSRIASEVRGDGPPSA